MTLILIMPITYVNRFGFVNFLILPGLSIGLFMPPSLRGSLVLVIYVCTFAYMHRRVACKSLTAILLGAGEPDFIG